MAKASIGVTGMPGLKGTGVPGSDFGPKAKAGSTGLVHQSGGVGAKAFTSRVVGGVACQLAPPDE